jgi:hypothetical protein
LGYAKLETISKYLNPTITMKPENMKAIRLVTFLLLVTAFVPATGANAGRQTRQIAGFHGISVTSGIDLYLTQKAVEQVAVEAESEDLDKIKTEVEGGILKIYIKEKSWFNLNFNHRARKVYVSFKTLDKLEASAGSDVVSEGRLKLDKLNLDASSGSDVKLELDVNNLRVGSSSGSDISLEGTATDMQANASSGSDINANELHSKNCDVSVSSGSDIKVNVSEKLDASASSGGDISYSGNPKIKDINESSGGDVHSR